MINSYELSEEPLERYAQSHTEEFIEGLELGRWAVVSSAPVYDESAISAKLAHPLAGGGPITPDGEWEPEEFAECEARYLGAQLGKHDEINRIFGPY